MEEGGIFSLFKRLKLITFLLLATFLIGCQQNSLNEDEKSRPVEVEGEDEQLSNELIDGGRNVRLYMDQITYHLPFDTIVFAMENKGSESITYGNEVYLDKFQDGVWVQIPYHSHFGFTMEAYELKPGEVVEQEVSVENFDDELTGGKYRIRKSIQLEEVEAVLAFEFRIEEVASTFFTGTIEEIVSDDLAIVLATLFENNPEGLVFVNLSVNEHVQFEVGDKVKVGFDGIVRESNPAQITTLSVELIEK